MVICFHIVARSKQSPSLFRKMSFCPVEHTTQANACLHIFDVVKDILPVIVCVLGGRGGIYKYIYKYKFYILLCANKILLFV